jgi:hypothetical protein
MAERNEKVLERIRQELTKNPKVGSRELYESAQGLDRAIGEDTLQQFHARYVLPVKREQRGPGGGGETKRKARGGKGRPQQKAAAEQEPAQEQPARRTRRSRKGEEGADRDRIRGVLLEFARDFASAESRSDIVGVVSRVDEYVDRIAARA